MKYKIITPPTVEPVTMAEAKLHLRLDSNTFDGDVTTYQSIPPGRHEISESFSLEGAAVDVLGFLSLVTLNTGAVGPGGSVSAKIQDSDGGTTWRDFAGGAFATVTSDTDNAVQEIQYTGGKQYVRVVATVSGAACEFSADVLVKSGDVMEDALIADLITAAREYCEDITRRALAKQTIEVYLDKFPSARDIELPRPPLVSVTSVKYKDSAGIETTMTADADYLVDADSEPGRIVLPYGKSWPSFTPYPVNPVVIQYEAGYTTLPKYLKTAMLLHIGYFYNHRDAVEPDDATERAIRTLCTTKKAGWF